MIIGKCKLIYLLIIVIQHKLPACKIKSTINAFKATKHPPPTPTSMIRCRFHTCHDFPSSFHFLILRTTVLSSQHREHSL